MRLAPTISLLLCLLAAPCLADGMRLLVQSSPLAGSQYYDVDNLWHEMKVGDRLTLIREPENRYDRFAIRVEWRGHKLGYVPRAENRTVAGAMDGGERVSGRISRLRDDANPWKRVEIEIFVDL